MKTKYLFTSILVFLLISCNQQDLKNNGCQDPAITVNADTCTFTIANIFTPEGNGENDLFKIYSSCGFTAYSMTVSKGNTTYFSSNDANVGWDGTFNGSDATEGVYNYSLSGTTINGYSFSENGTIALNRDISNNEIDACGNCVPPQTLMEPYCQH